MDPMMKYPRLRDLEPVARRRIPPFIFAYLDSGTGHDVTKAANSARYEQMTLTPQFLRGRVDPDTSVSLLGRTYAAPFGVAPVGLSSTIWPGAERILAAAAKAHGFPYTLSTVAGESIERVAAVGGDMAWFQLYAPQDRDIGVDLIRRARESGVETLGVTADVPAPSRRERMRIAGAPLGSRGNSMYSPAVLLQAASRPNWALRMLANGGPRFRNMEPYADRSPELPITKFIGSQLNGGSTGSIWTPFATDGPASFCSRAFSMARMRNVPCARAVTGWWCPTMPAGSLMRHHTRLTSCRIYVRPLAISFP